MKKSAQMIAGKLLTVMFSIVMILGVMPTAAITASAFYSYTQSVSPAGATQSYSATAIGGTTSISCSPSTMFDSTKTHVSGTTLYYYVKANYTSAARTGTITLYKNGVKNVVLTVKQSKITLNVTSASSATTVSGNGESLSFKIVSNMPVTAYLTGEGATGTLGTYGSATYNTWTTNVTLNIPAHNYVPTTTSVTQNSSYQNRDRAIGFVFCAGPSTKTCMYTQPPKGFMFGKSTSSAPFGTVCYNGKRYKIETTNTPPTSGQQVSLHGVAQYNWWNLFMCEFEGGDEYAPGVNALSVLCSLINGLSNVKSTTSVYMTLSGDYAYLCGYDTATKNALIDSRAVVTSGDYSIYFSNQRWGTGTSNNFYKLYIDGDGKLCMVLNYMRGSSDAATDRIYKNGVLQLPGVYIPDAIRPAAGTTALVSGVDFVFPPFYATQSYIDALDANNLLGTY